MSDRNKEYLYGHLTTFAGHQVVYCGNGDRIILYRPDENGET